jgi:type IV pilus assembly protein PilA
MAVARTPGQSGLTLIELMIVVAIVGLLAAIGVGQWREYTRRARMSDVVLAIGTCKTRVSESYLSLPSAPASASGWGCDASLRTQYATAVQTSASGAIRVTIGNLDAAVNGLYVHMIPAHSDGATPMSPGTDLGTGVAGWICGSDAQQVRAALPSGCRTDTTPFASLTYE